MGLHKYISCVILLSSIAIGMCFMNCSSLEVVKFPQTVIIERPNILILLNIPSLETVRLCDPNHFVVLH